MNKKIILISFTIFMLIHKIQSQNPINVQITGDCSNVSGVYSYINILNGKNNYSKDFVIEGNPVTVYISFDSTKWVLHNGNISDSGFINFSIPINLVPPTNSWEISNCSNGTMVLNEVLKNKEFENNKISIFPNPSYEFIEIQSTFNGSEKLNYNIIDLIGRNIKSGNCNFNEKINIEELPIGSYFIEILLVDRNSSKKKLLKK